MEYQFNFGTLAGGKKVQNTGKKFRLAVLGDFSGRATRGKIEIGDELANRKGHKVDVDNLDDVVKRFGITLNLPLDGGDKSIALEIGSLDDLHPDELYEKLEIFSELSVLRQRLKSNSTFAAAAKEVQGWGVESGKTKAKKSSRRSRGAELPINARLSDFARLIGQEADDVPEASPIDQLIRSIVGPHVIPSKDPRQDQMIAAVDKSLSAAMSSVLHHPDFQSTESMLRTLELLVRTIETSTTLQIVVYDVSVEEIAADLSQSDALEESGLYRMLVEAPSMDAAQGALSVVLGLYTFDHTPPHAEILGRIARIAAAANAPFLSGIRKDILLKEADEPHQLIKEAWDALRAMPQAKFLGLAAPRFLLRAPYGRKTESIDPFDYEEFNIHQGLGTMLWANAAVLPALLLALSFGKEGEKMRPGKFMSIGDQPYYVYTDSDGDTVALPCTERMLTTRQAQEAIMRRVMPILSIKGRNEIRLATWQSVGNGMLGGFWHDIGLPAENPEDDLHPIEKIRRERARAAEKTDSDDDSSSSSSDDDLDSLLGDLSGGDASSDSSDDDLDALLNDLGSDDDSSSSGGGDDDLDSLLNDLGGDDGGSDSSGDAGGDELDDLLASLGSDDESSEGGDDDMDPDLAALLADL